MNKPVVVGVEDKQPSAVRFAAEAATARGVDLHVVHCVEPLLTGEIIGMPDESWAAAGQGTLDGTRELIEALESTPSTEYALLAGPPSQMLRSKASKASLLVIGTDSPGRVDRFFDGSVAGYLIKHATAPVAVVPERRWPGDLSGGVFVALDAKTLATGPLRFAFEEASRRDKVLHVVHVVPAETAFVDTPEVSAGLSEVLAGWCEEYPDVRVTRRIVFDQPDEGCLRASEQAELLVLGRHDSVVPLPFQHPVLTQIARRAHCPCVVVPDTWSDDA